VLVLSWFWLWRWLVFGVLLFEVFWLEKTDVIRNPLFVHFDTGYNMFLKENTFNKVLGCLEINKY